MSNLNLRKQPRISYYESEEPIQDDYVFCADCVDFVYEYCAIHGPLLVIPDDKVSSKSSFPEIVPHAALTVPHTFLHLARSVIPGAGIGVFSTLSLPRGVRFGPYRGVRTNEIDSTYCWQMYDRNMKPLHIDAADANRSNWMQYVNCSRHWCEQNLIAYQYQGEIYYRTIKVVPAFTELMVYYGSEFANLLGVDLKIYNSLASYVDIGTSNVKIFGTMQREPIQEQESNNTVVTPGTSNVKKIGTMQREPIQEQESNNTVVTPGTSNVKKFGTIQREPIQEQKFSCDICAFKTSHSAQLAGHINAHAANKSYDCYFCPYKAIKRYSLKRHIKQHIGINKFSCTICHKRFTDESLLNIHSMSHPGDISHVLSDKEVKALKEECNLNNKNPNEVHVDNIINGKLSCNMCLFKTSREIQMTSHLKAHASANSYDCELCPYKALKKYRLESHMMTHIGIKNYSCNICHKRFSDESLLNIHLRSHSDDNVSQRLIVNERK